MSKKPWNLHYQKDKEEVRILDGLMSVMDETYYIVSQEKPNTCFTL
jgi:hypothetical protein